MRLAVVTLVLTGCFGESRTDVASFECDGDNIIVKDRHYYVGILPESRTERELWLGDRRIPTVREPFPSWHPALPAHRAEGPRDLMLHVSLDEPGLADPTAGATCLLSHRQPVVDAMRRTHEPGSQEGMIVWTAPSATPLRFGTDNLHMQMVNRGTYAVLRTTEIDGPSTSYSSAGRVGKDTDGTLRIIVNSTFVGSHKPHTWKNTQGDTIEQVFGAKAEYLDHAQVGAVFKAAP